MWLFGLLLPFYFCLFVCLFCCLYVLSYLSVCVHNLVFVSWGLYIWAYGQNAINHLKSFSFPPLSPLSAQHLCGLSLCFLCVHCCWVLSERFPPSLSSSLPLSTQHLGGLSYSVGVFPFCVLGLCVCVCLALLLCGCVEVMCTQQCCIVSGPEHSSGPVWSPAQQVGQPWWGCGYWCCYPGKNKQMLSWI